MPNENKDWIVEYLSSRKMSPDEMYNTSQNIARQKKIDEGIPIFGNGYAGNIVGGIGENLLGGFSDLAKFANLDRVSNTLEEGSNYFTERLKPAKEAEFSLDYITSPEGLARGTGRTGGSVLSIVAPAALTEGASLWATGASLATRGGALLSKIPGISSRAAQFAAGGLLTVPPEAAMEAGSFEKNAVLNGMSPSEAADKSWGVFGRNVGELAISNALQFGMLPKLAGRGTTFGRRMGTAGAELGIQAAEEAYQQGIQNEMAGKPYSYNPYEIITNPELGEQRQAALEGFMTMIPIIGGGAVGGHLIDKATGKNEDAQPVNDYDPNFTAKQNQMWQLAQYASARARDKFNLDIPAELIYRQWAEESYQTFDSDMAQSYNNYAGLKDTEGNWRQFNDEQEFADAYIDDFIRYRPELNGITDIEEFANIMADTGYFGRGELSQYIEGMKAATVPNARNINFYADDEDETVPADFGEGKYWIRQGDNVSYEGAQAQTMPALYALSKWFYEHTGKPLVVSAVTNGDSHVEGEHSHGNGWKFDVHDGGSGAEGTLFTDDFQRGELLDEFVKYGQSLGLGMNVESLGTGNVHLDVSAAGDQWEGEFAGHNFGGFKGNKATPAKNKDAAPNISAAEQPSTGNEGDSVIDGIIQNLLTQSPEVQPTFNLQGKTDLDKEIFKMFVDERKNNSEGEDAAAFINFLQDNHMLNDKGNFVSNKGNRKLLRENFGEEIQEFGDNLIAERYNRFMESQKSAAEKIQAAFTNLVQREVDEGSPDAMKHQQILQDGNVDAMTQLLKDANINFDAAPSESQPQTESDEILNPADGWQKFSPDNQAKLVQHLKSELAAEGVLDENLATALDNGDAQAISNALQLFRQINRDKPIQQILNADAETLSDDAQKFRENYLKLQDDIAQLEQQRAHYEADMQQKSSEKGFYTGNEYRVYDYYGDKNQIAEIDKKLEKARAELQNLQAPKNFKRVSESEQLENDILKYSRTVLALNQRRIKDLGEPNDRKTARQYNKLVREHNAALENLWKAQARYDELNDAGKTWRESASLNANSPVDLFNLVQLGIEQTQRKLDAIQRTSRKASDNPKATQNAMRLGSQLATLKSVLTTQVNPTVNVSQAIEGIADARNTFDTLREQLIDTAQKIKDAESQGDTATAESLKAQLPQLQNQAANAYANYRTLNEETAKAIWQTAPQALSKVYGQRENTINPVADDSAENVDLNTKQDIQPNSQPVQTQQQTPLQLPPPSQPIQIQEMPPLPPDVQISQPTPQPQPIQTQQQAPLQLPPPSQENVQPQFSPIEKATQELEDLKTQLARATKDKDSEDDSTALAAYKQIEPLKKQINAKTQEFQNLKDEQKRRAEMTPLDKAKEELSTLKAQARETVKARQDAEKNKDDKTQLAAFRKQEELDKQIAQKKDEIKNLQIEQLQNEIPRLQEEQKKLIATRREAKKIGDQKAADNITKQLETLKKNINQKINQLQQLGGKLKSQPSQPVQTPPVQENIQPADNVQSPQQNIQPAKSVQTPKTESAVQEKSADNVQSPKTESQPNNNPLNQLTDEEFENIRNAVNNVRRYFGGMDELPIENFSDKEQNLLRQTGMTHKTDNEFSGKEEEVLHLESFDNAVNSRLKSGKTQPPVQENPAPAEQVQSQKIKSTFAQDVLPNENVLLDENRVVEGDETKIVADNGKEYEVQYKVVEADDLVASHYLNLEDSKVDRNENYPVELQPRDRDRISMQAELLSMYNSLRPADLMDSRNLNQGAPIVRSDNVVLNGNGRTAAIKFAYENGKADHYKQVLVNSSEKFGLDRNAVAQMKNPVLVREITDNLSAQDLQAITESQTGGVKFGASEQAKNDAGKIKIRTLDLYVDNDNGDITTADNREFLVSVLQDILNKNELNAYTTADGGINVDGQRRAKRALFALAYDDDMLIDKIAESTDDNIKRITNALESAAPRMAQIQAKMKKGILHRYDLSEIASAAAKLSDLRQDKNLTVQDYLGQQVLAGFGEESEIKKALVKFFDEHKNSAIYISDFLKGVADGIERQGDPTQIDLFGDVEPAEAVPLMNLIDNAKEIAADKLRERSERAKPKQINLFEEPEETPKVKTPAEILSEAVDAPAVQNEEEQVPLLDLQQPPVVKNEKPKENLNKEDKIDVTSPEAWRTIEETAADVKGLRRRKKETATDDDIMDISHVAPNIDISEEDRLWAELDKELKKLSANPIFNPKIYTIGLKLGMLYIKKGMSKFSDWAKELTNKGGANIKPWLSSIWETIRSYPPKTNFDEELISTFSEYIGSLIANKQAKTYEDVLARFEETFEKEDVDKFAPVIESAYKGIKKFFDENSNNQQDAENEQGTRFNLREAREIFKEKMLELKDVDIVNKATGIVAQVGKSGRRKPLSDVAIEKSIKNGYSVEQHFEAAMNIKQLFEEGWLAETREDRNQEPNVLSIKYFNCETTVKGEKAIARIMVKEIAEYGHKIYTIELQELNKPVELVDRIDSNPSTGSKNSTHNYHIADSRSAEEFSNINITQSTDEGKAKSQENAPAESQSQNAYTELQRKAQRGENLTTEEKTILVSNPENLVVDEKLREALYKKLPNVKHCIDIAFRAVKQFGTTDAKKTLTQILVSDNTDNAVYAYATQELIRLWGFERALKQTRKVNPSKIRDKNKETEQLLKQYRIKEISAKELYGRTLKALYNLNEKSHRKPTSDYALNLENFKLYGKKSETRTTGDSKIIAKMSSDYKGVIVTQTTNGGKLTYQIPLNEIDKAADDNDAIKNLVDKYLSNAYKKLATENNIPAEQIQESIEGVLERFANYHEVVVSNMHGHFREEVPSDENATPAENQKEEKAAPTEDKKPKNDDSPKPLLLQDGRKPYEVYKQTLDKKGQEFLEEPLGVFEIQRHNLVEDAVRDKKPRDSLKTEAERKYYDWLKAQLNENLPEGYTIEERRLKGDNGRDEYTAIVKGDFKTDAGKKLLNNLKELAEKLGGELKQSSDKVASFYFGEKTKPLKQFQTAAKVLVNQKESAAEESVAPKNDERPTLNDIDQRAQQILKEVGLENRRPKKDEGFGRLYGNLNSDGTLTLQFDKKSVNAETLTSLENLADKVNGTVSVENDSYKFNFKNVEDLAVFSRAVRTAFYGERSIPVRDNKAAVGDKIITLPEGYKTETGKELAESDNKDFIVDEDGNKNLGTIPLETEKKTNGIVKAAPIRLQVGNYDFGYIHLSGIHLQEMQNKGFDNPIAYVKHILQNFSKIYSRADTGNINRFILCVEGANAKKSKDFMPIDLELEKGEDGYYRIVTAYPKREKK